MGDAVPAGAPWRATDLAVVVPTRDRWPTVERFLDAVAAQTVTGFSVVLAVDGQDQHVDLGRHSRHPGVRVVTAPRAGPGTARNAGVDAGDRPLVLLLGDDILPEPTLVANHLDAHVHRPAPVDAVLGLVRWHPEAASGRLQQWLEWSGAQFDYAGMSAPGPVGWARFYSSNVSFKTELFRRAGGFDPTFGLDYEDIELGWRMEQAGMRLWYEPAAVGLHVHRYDWAALRRRFENRARAERLMVSTHPWFEPWFRQRCLEALSTRPPRPWWPFLVDHLPAGRLRSHARAEANRWYFLQLAPFFLNAWSAEDDFEELRAYLGDRFEASRLYQHSHEIESEWHAAPDEETFYRTSEAYLYDLTAFGTWATKVPYRRDVSRYVAPGSRLLDYGCGIGSDGLRFIERGYRVDFADFDNPSTRYLRWRLGRRAQREPLATAARLLDIDGPIDGGYDLVYSFDVIEHVPEPFAFLERLERLGRLVAVNFLEPDPGDPHPHRELPVRRLLDHAERRGLLRYRVYNDRSHFVVYGSPAPSPRRSTVERRLGPLLSRPLPGRAPSSPGGACWRQG